MLQKAFMSLLSSEEGDKDDGEPDKKGTSSPTDVKSDRGGESDDVKSDHENDEGGPRDVTGDGDGGERVDWFRSFVRTMQAASRFCLKRVSMKLHVTNKKFKSQM